MLWTDEKYAVTPSAGDVDSEGRDFPTTAGETFQAAWSRNNLFGQNYNGEHDRFSALDDYLKTIEQRTGQKLGPDLDYGSGEYAASAFDLLRQTNDRLNKLKKDNPAIDLEPMSNEQFEQNAVDKRRKADADYEAVMARPRGPGATIGAVAGHVLAGGADPINLASMTIAPEASLGIMKNFLQWGAYGAGVGGVEEALQAPYQEEVHPGYLGSAALANVVQGALFAGASGAAFRGVANAWDRMRTGAWPQSIKDAGNIVSSQANINATNVYPGIEGATAHLQALSKTIDDVLHARPVDVSDHITPELEASAGAPAVEDARVKAQAAQAEAARLRAAPAEPAPELPFERTAAEAEAEARKQTLTNDVQDASRNVGYDMPIEKAGAIADKMIDATPQEAEKIFRDLQMSPRQVADAPQRLEPPAEPISTPVEPIADIHASDFQGAVRADLDRELLHAARDFRAAGFSIHEAVQLAAEQRAPYALEGLTPELKLRAIDARRMPPRLPENHDLYFDMEKADRVVSIGDLVSSKTDEENAKGGRNAPKRMAATAAGEIAKRPPITVRPLPDGKFLVVDGNGTLSGVKQYGWQNMPVQVEPALAGTRSEIGIPSSEAKPGDTGGALAISPKEAPPGTHLSPLHSSTLPEPSASLTQRYAPPSIFPVSRTVRFSDFAIGDIDRPSNKKIFHGTNDLKALMAAAADNEPQVSRWLQDLASQIPGVTFHGSRVKDTKGLMIKVTAKNRPPNTISDFLGARLITDTPAALYGVVDRIRATGGVIDGEEFIAQPKLGGYRGVHLQLGLGDGTSVELQVLPRPIADNLDEAHAIRDPVKRILDAKTSTPEEQARAEVEMAKSQKILDDAWSKAPGWGAPEVRPPERIAEVAIRDRDTGKIYSAPDRMHVDMYERAAADLGMRYSDAYNARAVRGGTRFDEGFTTDTGRFVGRHEAASIADRIGQAREINKRVGLDAGAIKWSAPIPSSSLPNGVTTFSPYELGVDADRFQFKAGGDEAGVTDRLKGVTKWDDIKAGMSLVWVDKDGKPWIADGHQRLALARRIAAEDPSQQPRILARTLREEDGITAEQARGMAALKNIAEGTGTAVDAAKVIRDHPDMIEDLPPRSELVRQARGLANLSDDAFRMIVNDVIPPNYGAIVGRLVPDDAQMQGAIVSLLAKTDPANAVQAEAIARQGIEAGLRKSEAGAQASLFGEQEVAESLYSERAKVLDRALKTLRRDKTVFGTLVKEQETLETAGNVLAKEINEQRATADGQAIQILQTLANRTGPISDALRAAAASAKTDGYPAAVRTFVGTVRDLSASGELSRLANGIERGATHVGNETPAGIVDHGLAAEPGEPAAIDAAEQQIKDQLQQPPELAAPAFEPGAEGLPQAIMPGMAPSARQLAAARAGPLRGGVPQQAPGGLFEPPEERLPDLFPIGMDAGGRVNFQNLDDMMHELDGYKLAADQIAQCATEAPAEAA
jgi:ppGpp synthetase/RelA/SpoT-type nucleotidyltranferase